MKTFCTAFFAAALGLGLRAAGPPSPPSIAGAPTRQAAQEKFVYEQRLASDRAYLVTSEQAKTIIDRFKRAYPRLGNPRMLIYLNPALSEAQTGSSQKPAEGNTAATDTKGTDGNTGRTLPSLADRQTARDVERLFGRPLRMGGAQVVDQAEAAQALSDKPASGLRLASDSSLARRAREAVAKVSDVVIEVLMSSKNVPVADWSGEKTYLVPDIQATAIRLSDARVLGQASSSDVLGKAGGAARLARHFDVNDITEATALALMEDMAMEADQQAQRRE